MEAAVAEKVNPSHLTVLNLLNAGEPYLDTSDQPPQDFSCKVESFKQLCNIISNTGVERYETSPFKKHGYRWKLILYPEGDTRNGGKDYISIYLVLLDSMTFPVGLKVHASFQFFVFNHNQLHYTTYEYYHNYSHGSFKFDKLKSGYGYPQLIPLSTFNDPSSGYLVDDTFVFGVNLTVDSVHNYKEKAKLERVRNSGRSIVRTSFKFSQLENEYYETEAFTAGGHEWLLRLYPGWINGSGNHLSLFLRLKHPKSVVGRVIRCFQGTTHENIHANFTLRIIDQLHEKHVEKTVCGVYSDSNRSWGCSDFIELCQLRDGSHGYIHNDNLVAEVDFEAIL